MEAYAPSGYDEVFAGPGEARPHYRALWRLLSGMRPEEFAARQERAALTFTEQGITFGVAGAPGGSEAVFPLDMVPRILSHHEWRRIERGVAQRVRALNLFLADIYGPQRCLRAGVVPGELVLGARHYRREVHGLALPGGAYTHVAGLDLIRDGAGRWMVLEDNLRSPSGISYVLSNRVAMTRIFPRLFSLLPVFPVDHYPAELLDTLRELAPRPGPGGPVVALLTPGVHNAAYFEHSFLAGQMGVDLVEARDLVARDAMLYVRTTRGLQRVDVLYRRVDDDFLDPLAFRPDSLLGTPGLVQACRSGNLAVANGIGAGVADDKAVYAFVPRLIRYFLGEEPLLDQVETHLLGDPGARRLVLGDLRRFVIKATGESGGYGMMIGPQAGAAEVEEFRRRIEADPRNYVAQPLVALSTHPCFIDGQVLPRRVDLRVFALAGREVRVVPGGLTRVALRSGSYVVNSSQGGGSKDTWVLADGAPV